jgi:hypothetical protein
MLAVAVAELQEPLLAKELAARVEEVQLLQTIH